MESKLTKTISEAYKLSLKKVNSVNGSLTSSIDAVRLILDEGQKCFGLTADTYREVFGTVPLWLKDFGIICESLLAGDLRSERVYWWLVGVLCDCRKMVRETSTVELAEKLLAPIMYGLIVYQDTRNVYEFTIYAIDAFISVVLEVAYRASYKAKYNKSLRYWDDLCCSLANTLLAIDNAEAK